MHGHSSYTAKATPSSRGSFFRQRKSSRICSAAAASGKPGCRIMMGRVLKTPLAVSGATILFMIIFVAVGIGIPVPGFFGQWGSSLMDKPELPVFQYLRGLVWLLCLVPVILGFTGGRKELIILSGLTLALLPTAQLAFPNPLTG
jgi:hypothetical protein